MDDQDAPAPPELDLVVEDAVRAVDKLAATTGLRADDVRLAVAKQLLRRAFHQHGAEDFALLVWGRNTTFYPPPQE